MIYELADSRDLPVEVQGEDATVRYRLRVMYRLHEPEKAVDRDSDEEVVALAVPAASAALSTGCAASSTDSPRWWT
ncbi:hypothetical protein [Streptomyces sp. NPDC054834]